MRKKKKQINQKEGKEGEGQGNEMLKCLNFLGIMTT